MTNRDERQPELDDPRVIAALDEYLAALEAGQKPDRRGFLSRYAEIAGALGECLDGMEALHEANSSSRQAGPRWSARDEWHPGASLGDFRILREIGRGGMGVVYEAEQISLGRRIALKVLPFALTLDPKQLQRFKNEARAAAQLHHQHIVPVYYVGSERGVHFYAMQYIEGQSLAEVIRELRQLAERDGAPAPPTAAGRLPESTCPYVSASQAAAADTAAEPVSALATAYSTGGTGFFRSVARLGIQTAEALEHAHEYGVVHRDIKPANVLVDAHGHAWITDFGLAQFQTDAGLTQTGDLLGTLRYMSPEQAGGGRALLDLRTDVYSLGATLYELLTLRPPFDGADRQTLLRQILHDEPPAPRSLRKSIPVELETIVLKALAKLPAERYATARDLADDLGRFLHDQPIQARRPSVFERATKWTRRHRSVFMSAVAALLLTVAGLGIATVLTARAYDRERAKAQEADENFRRALQAVNQLVQIGEDQLADRPDLDGLRWQLLETTLVYFQDFIDQHRDDPAISQELEAGRVKVKTILAELSTLRASFQYIPLHQPEVQDELDLSPTQREAIGKIQRRWYEEFHQPFRPSRGERERSRVALARDQEEKVAQILTAKQFRRFKQIALQFVGPLAFSDPDAIAELSVTPAQQQQIRDIQEATRPGPHFGGPNHKPPPPPNDPRVRTLERIVNVLTEEQRSKWQQLLGARCQYELHPCPPKPFGSLKHAPADSCKERR